ncbi:DNA adenine methylase [Enterocloster bolteae]|nr:DNA adenine methylase [Enterocloster bolteae]RGS10826.1 DNA adenine methylase [Enterocloster bolteae]
MKCILKYPGAKNRIANWICEYIPSHDVYLEPYFGSGAVFFNKVPARIETLNDLDGNVVNYFKVVRERPNELAVQLEMTPYSRDEYYRACEYDPENSDIEKARKFAVRCWMGYGASNYYVSGFRSSQQSKSPYTTKEWRNLPERLLAAGERLKNAQIENLPAMELIRRYDTPDVFMYVDPPYLHGTRKNYFYRYEMGDAEHIELLKLLAEHPGKVLLSGYDNDLYNQYLLGWRKAQKKTQAEAGIPRVETLWMNYEIGQAKLKL